MACGVSLTNRTDQGAERAWVEDGGGKRRTDCAQRQPGIQESLLIGAVPGRLCHASNRICSDARYADAGLVIKA
jgi:hypothetical protein